MRPIQFVFLPTFLLTTQFSTMVLAQSTPGISTAVISSSAPLVSKSAVGGLSQPDPARQAKIVESYGKLPLSFEANQGQADARVKFLSRTGGYTLFLSGDEAVLAWSGSAAKKPASKGASGFGGDTVSLKRYPDTKPNLATAPSVTDGVLRMKLVNANPKTEVSGQDELPGKSNYFIGNDPKKWHANVRQFSKVRYENVYPGVDLVYYGNQRQLEYDFVLQPGASPQAIRLGIAGAKQLRLEHGDLVLTSAGGDVHLRSPHIYQEANGVRHEIRGGYVIKSKREVGFEVAGYDRRRALVIDPVLAYSTFLGGSGADGDLGVGIAVDSSGQAYVTGQTCSIDFPTLNSIHPYAGNCDAFVTKFNADGSALVYSTFLGGKEAEEGEGIAVDSEGNVYVTGATWSTDFPTVNAIQPHFGGGSDDAFVTKINAAGSALVYSTYLGGSGADGGSGIALDSAGDAYVAGNTASTNFPTKNAIQSSYGGGNWDAFVTKINAAGTALVYSTYLGGSDDDYGQGVAVDSVGNAYTEGTTFSTNFPTKKAIQPAYGGGGDAFVTKINAAGSALVFSTYLGGSSSDWGSGIAVDSAGNAYVTGFTQSTDFPTFNAIQPTLGSSFMNAFVTKFNAGGSAFVYSTYIGGNTGNRGTGIAADSAGNAYVTGYFDADVFVTEINAGGSAIVYTEDLYEGYATGIAVDSADSAYLTGWNFSNDFPTTPFAFQQAFKGSFRNAFVAKIAAQTFVGVSPTKLSFPVQSVGIASFPKKLTLTNQGSGPLTINRIFFGGLNPGDFSETNTCGASLAAGAGCKISVTFTPSAKNLRQAALGISDSDPASPQAIPLYGTGTDVLLSTKKLSFGDQPVGTTSAPQNVILTNVGSTQLTMASYPWIRINGVNKADFSETNTCGKYIAAKASCTITVTFTPTATGTRRANVSINDDGGGSPQVVYLKGTGI